MMTFSQELEQKENRVILFRFFDNLSTIRIDFGYSPGKFLEQDKINSGSINFLRSLKQAARSLQAKGFMIYYSAGDDRRDRIYENGLRMDTPHA